jgi:hypothetical protein
MVETALRSERPFADRIEVGAPRIAALAARGLGRLPERIRRRVLQTAFDRASDAVFDFWRGVRERYDDSNIENLSLEEATPGCIVRRARLSHRSSARDEELTYVIVQTTELDRGYVVRQINVLETDARL